jgi:hypothetical protein
MGGLPIPVARCRPLPFIVDAKTTVTRLAWFGALWACEMLIMEHVAAVLRRVLSHRGRGAAGEPASQ